MKKFKIVETRPATYTWYYEVEAESEEQALEMVMEGLQDPVNTDVEASHWEDSEYEIIDEQ